MIHPARSMVESLHDKGACPRIHVDLTRKGVVCPDFLREQWKEELVIDLDPTYPLDLSFSDDGLQADLSFGGFVTRCTFPFDSIYVVADRDTGRGIVLDENMPESVRRKRQPAAQREAQLRAQGKRERAGTSRRRRRPRDKPELAAAPEPAAEPNAAKDPAVEADAEQAESTSNPAVEQEAQRRRSGFQVIDGDG
jgi:stringent starvation protein B